MNEILHCISESEINEFNKYKKDNFNVPNIDELLSLDLNKYLISKTLVEIYEQVYISDTIKDNISKLLPKNPKYIYTEARAMRRQFFLHVGNTNTGKTYEALERLKQANTGVYLGPLRLLAMEIQDKFLDSGILCKPWPKSSTYL